MLKLGIGEQVPPFRVMDVIQAANARAATLAPNAPAVLRMEIGQPATGLPQGAREAVEAALRSGDALGYTEGMGRAPLRARLAEYIQQTYGVNIAPSRIAITMGASAAFPLTFLSCFQQGDKIALAAPYYPPYYNILVALGLCPVVIPCGIETSFQPSVEMLKALPEKPDGLIIASPANPTGSMLAPATLEGLCRYCDEVGIRLISDEIYHGLTYGKAQASASQFSDNAVVINSFSKYFSMTGWRIGWAVLPENLVRVAERLATNFFISAPYISQVAAQAALDCHEELDAHKLHYAHARETMITGLRAAGFTKFAPPDGAFYVYVDIEDRAPDSAAFCTRLLNEQNIAATPGYDFDAARGGRYVRFSYCGALSDVQEAMARLKRMG